MCSNFVFNSSTQAGTDLAGKIESPIRRSLVVKAQVSPIFPRQQLGCVIPTTKEEDVSWSILPKAQKNLWYKLTYTREAGGVRSHVAG